MGHCSNVKYVIELRRERTFIIPLHHLPNNLLGVLSIEVFFTSALRATTFFPPKPGGDLRLSSAPGPQSPAWPRNKHRLHGTQAIMVGDRIQLKHPGLTTSI